MWVLKPKVNLGHIQIDEIQSIRFRNVNFNYQTNKRKSAVFKNMSFYIEKGDVVLLLGESGSGKSTLINLICRLYDLDDCVHTDNGEILINNQNIQDIRIKELRKQISVVPQTILMFDTTIEKNITLDSPNPESKENQKKIDDLIELLGLPVKTTNGKKLSYGQKQRVLIARSLYNEKKSVYIFDEYLSAVDKQTRQKIHGHVIDFLKSITNIL